MRKKQAGDFKSAAEVAQHVETLVEGWASVIRCKAESFGGIPCGRIVMVVFRDFYQPLIGNEIEEWDSSRALVCENCATRLGMLDHGSKRRA